MISRTNGEDMTKIGILNCSNVTQELGCAATDCLRGMYRGEAAFAEHNNQGGAQLVGIVNCAGCPTAVAPEKILRKVRSLEAAGAETIHLSSCLMGVCPFKNKYIDLLKEHFPQLKVVGGTHGAPVPGMTPEIVQGAMQQALSMEKPSMVTVGKIIAERLGRE